MIQLLSTMDIPACHEETANLPPDGGCFEKEIGRNYIPRKFNSLPFGKSDPKPNRKPYVVFQLSTKNFSGAFLLNFRGGNSWVKKNVIELSHPGFGCYQPWKMNGWKLKNHPVGKVHHLNQASFFGGVPHVDFPSVIFSHGPNSDSNIQRSSGWPFRGHWQLGRDA